jgi:SAM-dependent methyltransferase
VLSNVGRVLREQESYQEVYEQARQKEGHPEDFAVVSTLYRSRGVSLDTSLLPNFALEEALKAMQARGLLPPGSVRRAAVIGPGLDFTDKAGGYDFYPQQTIQCFALADSLFRLGLARPGELQLTTFDISQRVNDHLRRARRRAQLGQAYVLQLPHDPQSPWNPPTAHYWQQFGDQIGAPVAPIRPPTLAGTVETRAVQIRPAITSMITPVDLNIVTQHLDLPPQEGFDLIIATNVFPYFDSFEQLLAVANTQAMLRPGGFLLSNNLLPLLPAFQMRALDVLSVLYSDRANDGDVISWYQRSPD